MTNIGTDYRETTDGDWFPVGDAPEEIVSAGIRAKQTSGFNINSFISDIRVRGVVRSHSFMVNIVPPKILRDIWSDTRNILIRCDSASLPSVNFQMNDIFRHGYGPQETSPHSVQFEPINLTFILDSEAELYNFWYTWVNRIMNFNRAKGLNSPNELGAHPYELSYKDDFATEIKILVYNETADTIIQASMEMAFPMGLSEVSLNWTATDDIIRLNIPISYRDFYAQTLNTRASEGVFDFLSNTYNSNSLNTGNILDQFNLFGLRTNTGQTSKLDRLLSDILLR